MKNRPFTTIADAPDLLTVPESQIITLAGRNLTYQMIRDGRLKSIRVGRKVLIPRSALAAFIGAG
jgi:excisionase family DNA binding protein